MSDKQAGCSGTKHAFKKDTFMDFGDGGWMQSSICECGIRLNVSRKTRGSKQVRSFGVGYAGEFDTLKEAVEHLIGRDEQK